MACDDFCWSVPEQPLYWGRAGWVSVKYMCHVYPLYAKNNWRTACIYINMCSWLIALIDSFLNNSRHATGWNSKSVLIISNLNLLINLWIMFQPAWLIAHYRCRLNVATHHFHIIKYTLDVCWNLLEIYLAIFFNMTKSHIQQASQDRESCILHKWHVCNSNDWQLRISHKCIGTISRHHC